MTRRSRLLACVVWAFGGLVACGARSGLDAELLPAASVDGGGARDGGREATAHDAVPPPDAPVMADAPREARIDATPVVDAGRDAPAGMDAGVDARPDSGPQADAGVDAARDAAPDGDAGPAHTTYLKASNSRSGTIFGELVAISADANTLAVSGWNESSDATGVDGNQSNTSDMGAGAVYVFSHTIGVWTQQAYLKASNTQLFGAFGLGLALSADGNTLAVGSDSESSDATGIDGDQSNMSASRAGAVYVFTRSAGTWSQQAYVKASNTRAQSDFGYAVALSSDGSTMAVGAYGDSSDATGVNGVESDMSAPGAGAVYVFSRSGTTWSQEAYVKASNTTVGVPANFGVAVTLSSDGNTLGVGAWNDASDATGINGDESDTSAPSAGAVYLFSRTGTLWAQEAYVKASNAATGASFGVAVTLSSDASTLAVGAFGEASDATGIDGNQSDTSDPGAGAV
jgi:hypothetical protein